MNRFWFWLQPALALVLLGFMAYSVAAFTRGDLPLYSFQFTINGAFVFPGMLLSLAINQAILYFRTPRILTRTERGLLLGLVAILAILIATSFGEATGVVGLVGWLVLVVYAIVLTAVLATTSARLKAAQPEPEDDGSIDDLLAGRED